MLPNAGFRSEDARKSPLPGLKAQATHRCPDESTTLFLCRKLLLAPPPPLLLAGPPARAPAAAMERWLAFYHTTISAAAAAADQDLAPYTTITLTLADPGPSAAQSAAGAEAAHQGRLWLHGSARSSPGLLGLVRTARLEAGGQHLRCVFDATTVVAAPAASERLSDMESSPNAVPAREATSTPDCQGCCGVAGEEEDLIEGLGAGFSGRDEGATEMVAAAAELDLVFNVFVDGQLGCFACIDLPVNHACAHFTMYVHTCHTHKCYVCNMRNQLMGCAKNSALALSLAEHGCMSQMLRTYTQAAPTSCTLTLLRMGRCSPCALGSQPWRKTVPGRGAGGARRANKLRARHAPGPSCVWAATVAALGRQPAARG